MTVLPYSVSQDPKAIETHVCIPLDKCKRQELDQETMLILTRMLLSGQRKEVIDIPEDGKPFLYKLIEKRIEVAHTYKITDPRVILFLCMITESAGSAGMILWYLQYWSKKHKVYNITLDHMCQRIFPLGHPSKEDLSRVWDSQKVSSEDGKRTLNLIDVNAAGKSLMNICSFCERPIDDIEGYGIDACIDCYTELNKEAK